jgi:hypothetical protein
MTWADLHRKSERAAAAAHLARLKGRESKARSLFAEAAQAETEALMELEPGLPRTFGTTAVSAVALWFKAGNFHEAQRVARRALDTAELPDFAAQQLVELQSSIEAVNSEKLPQEAMADVAPADMPSPSPAAIEPVWRDGLLTLREDPVNISSANFTAAVNFLGRDVRTLAIELKGTNINRRLVDYLDRFSSEILTATPDNFGVFRLGHFSHFLDAFVRSAEEELPPVHAARFVALRRSLELILQQSPQWSRFVRQADIHSFSEEQIQSATELATKFASVLRDQAAQEFINPLIPTSFERLKSSSIDAYGKQARRSRAELAFDIVQSANNTLRVLASIATSNATKAGEVRKWLGMLSIAAVGVGGANSVASLAFSHVASLISKYPDTFAWLSRILDLFK